jgi:putative transcriptional regulator
MLKAPSDMPPEPSNHRIAVRLDRLLEQRGMTLAELADKVGVTVVNLSVLKNGRARAIRFSTLAALLPGPRLPTRRPAQPPVVGDLNRAHNCGTYGCRVSCENTG